MIVTYLIAQDLCQIAPRHVRVVPAKSTQIGSCHSSSQCLWSVANHDAHCLSAVSAVFEHGMLSFHKAGNSAETKVLVE